MMQGPSRPHIFRTEKHGPDENFRVWIEVRCDCCRQQICIAPVVTGPRTAVTKIPAMELATTALRLGAKRLSGSWICVNCVDKVTDLQKRQPFGTGVKRILEAAEKA